MTIRVLEMNTLIKNIDNSDETMLSYGPRIGVDGALNGLKPGTL